MTQQRLPHVTAKRFGQGRTFQEWVAYIGSPENLRRPGVGFGGPVRRDWSKWVQGWYDSFLLTDYQDAALRELSTRPNAAAKLLVLAEDWSSDCRREVPTLARVAEAAGLELRIFSRDDAQGREPEPTAADDDHGNGDLMHQFVNRKNGGAFLSIPVAAFFTHNMGFVYHFTEYADIYRKDDFIPRVRDPRPGESAEEGAARGIRDFQAFQDGPFFRVWASAGVDQIIANLWERLTP